MKRKGFALLPSLCAVVLLAGCTMATGAKHDPSTASLEPVVAAWAPEHEAPTPGITAEQLLAVTLSDVPIDAPWHSAVAYGMAADYLQGDGGGRYMPDDLVTRAVAVTVLGRMEPGAEATAYDGCFSDVAARDWFAGAVAWGVDANVVAGAGDGNFYPNRTITREQLALMLQRCARRWGCDGGPAPLVEHGPSLEGVSDYARDAVEWAVGRGLFSGIAGGRFHPELPVSRAQLAQALLALEALREDRPLAGELVAARSPEVLPADVVSTQYVLIQEKVDEVARRYGAVGVQVAVVEHGDVSGTFTYGWATKDTAAMTADHKLRVASLSKVVLAMGAMSLLEDGVIDLDRPAGEYWGATFRNPYYPDHPITIRGMLTHTSSIFLAGDDVSREHAAVESRLSSGRGYGRVVPGGLASWGYNNYAYGVLGMTLELAAGQTMDQVLQEAYLGPLDIDASFQSGSLRNTDLLCTIYQHGGSVGRSVQTQKNLTLNPTPGSTGRYFAGGFTASAADLGKLVALLAGDGSYQGLRLLGSEQVTLMETKSAAPVSEGFYQCMPLRYRPGLYGRDGLYYHTGSAYGVYNCMSYDPATGDGVVVLSTGASAVKDDYGIYTVCSEIQSVIYDTLLRGAA